MARDFDPSASQQRAISLFGLTFDGTHAGAKAVLTAAGLTENGIPSGLSPVASKKLSDDELRAAFGVTIVDTATASTIGAAAIQAARDERNAESLRWQQIRRDRRDAENARIEARRNGEYIGHDHDENALDDMAATVPADHYTAQQQLPDIDY